MTIKPGRKPAIFYLPLQDGERKTDRAWRPFFRMLFENPRKVIAVTVLLSLVCVYPALQMRFDYNLMNLQARGLQSVEYAYKLMASRENSGYFTVIPTRDRNEALRLTERLERLPGVDHVVSMLTFVPDGQEAKLTELAELKRVMDEVRPVPYEENLRLMELPKVFESFRDRVDKLKSRWWPKERPRPSRWGASWLRWTVFFSRWRRKRTRMPLVCCASSREACSPNCPKDWS